MDHIIAGMSSDDMKVKVAAVRCLHSMSRSVQQLRTTFKDHHVWKPLMSVSVHQFDEIIIFSYLSLIHKLKEPYFLDISVPKLTFGLLEFSNKLITFCLGM